MWLAGPFSFPEPAVDHRKLTPAEVETLGQILQNTTKNVYREAEAHFRIEVGEDVFDQLRDSCDLFKCEGCGKWLDLGVEDESVAEFCVDCVAEMDLSMDDRVEPTEPS